MRIVNKIVWQLAVGFWHLYHLNIMLTIYASPTILSVSYLLLALSTDFSGFLIFLVLLRLFIFSKSAYIFIFFAGSVIVNRSISLCFLSLLLNFGFTHSYFKFLTGFSWMWLTWMSNWWRLCLLGYIISNLLIVNCFFLFCIETQGFECTLIWI